MARIKLSELIERNEVVLDDDEIVVPQLGKMKYGQLKKNIEGKAIDLVNKIKKGDYNKIADNQLELFSHLIRVARAYKEGKNVPTSTFFKEESTPMIRRDFWKLKDND